ncbi:MAG: EAL domain-containing protein, partial [Cellulomonadaceae bacterium]|nr:EAL domain-containing protein [Cellulomonadaceae bacterium]
NEAGQPVPAALVFSPGAGIPRDAAPGTAPAPLVVGAAPRSGAPVRWVQVTTRQLPTAEGSFELVTTIADMTGPREIRAALARSETQFRVAMENAPIGMVLADSQWRVMEANDAFASLLGTETSALSGRDLSTLSHPADRASERAHVQQVLAGVGRRFTLEKRYLRVDGQTVWAVLDAVLVRTPDGAPDHFVAQIRDSTESHMQSEMLAHRAAHDPLTGLANRSVMQETLERAMAPADAAGRVAVLVVDLDEFKEINDRYGHPAGDEVLVHVAGVLRAACGGRGTAARLGGDEFVVIVQDGDAGRAVFEVASRIQEGLANPVRSQRRRFAVRASIGVAVVDDALLGAGPMGALAAADAALYRAKALGRSRTEVYHPDMAVLGSSRHGAVSELAHAIDAGQLVLHYQPVIDLMDGTVVGHEALVRWQHPERGLLLPGSFLDTALEGGLGLALGVEVVSQAIAYLARDSSAGRWVSVNVSADQLGAGELAARIRRELTRYGVPPGRLLVELTDATLEVGSRARYDLGELVDAGLPVMIDAFGTGISPLGYLRELPVSGVKLDMSFTAGIPEDPAAARVSRGLGALAREMGMVTVAEGIETSEQAVFLRDAGWRYGQGWLFGAARAEGDVG